MGSITFQSVCVVTTQTQNLQKEIVVEALGILINSENTFLVQKMKEKYRFNVYSKFKL